MTVSEANFRPVVLWLTNASYRRARPSGVWKRCERFMYMYVATRGELIQHDGGVNNTTPGNHAAYPAVYLAADAAKLTVAKPITYVEPVTPRHNGRLMTATAVTFRGLLPLSFIGLRRSPFAHYLGAGLRAHVPKRK